MLTHIQSPFRRRERRVIAIHAMTLAFVVRLLWVLKIQAPFDAVYSDMAGYLRRAEGLLDGAPPPGDPQILAMWPWGTHALIAVELFVFHSAPRPIAIFHALVGALPAGGAVLLTARFTRSRAAMICAGVLCAFWHPHVIFSGYFSSELWFTSALWIAVIGFVRHTEEPSSPWLRLWSALLTGLALSMAFICRPQVILTCVLIGLAVILFRWRRHFQPLRWNWTALLAPLLVMMALSSIRLYSLTGHIGLISANGPVMSLFAQTDVDKLEADWVSDKGVPQTFWFNPHTKQPIVTVVHMDAFVCDPNAIAKVRAEHLRGVPWTARLRRMADNVALLAVRNRPWPEDDFQANPFRRRLQTLFSRITLGILPLAFYGLFCMRRHMVGQILVWANLATLIVAGALYLGEARYRVPYDAFLIVAAIVGLQTLLPRLMDRGGFQSGGVR